MLSIFLLSSYKYIYIYIGSLTAIINKTYIIILQKIIHHSMSMHHMQVFWIRLLKLDNLRGQEIYVTQLKKHNKTKWASATINNKEYSVLHFNNNAEFVREETWADILNYKRKALISNSFNFNQPLKIRKNINIELLFVLVQNPHIVRKIPSAQHE